MKNKLVIVLTLIVIVFGLYFFINSKKIDDKKFSSVESQELDTQEKIDVLYNKLKDDSGLTTEQFSIMNMIARDISIESQDTNSMKYTQALGYKWKTPWGIGTISEKTKNSEFLKQLEFTNGKKILLACSAQTPRYEFTTVDGESGASFPKEDVDQILRFLGSKADSSFDYMNLLLSSNVESIKNLDNPDSAEALSKLLILKSVSLLSVKQPYRFSVGNVRGFQYGDYSVPQITTIMIFPTNNERCDIMTSDKLTQKDVDIIVSTFSAI